MLAVRDFLNGMTKPQLKELHGTAFETKGLLNNAKILSETENFFTNVERFRAFYASLKEWQRLCISLIYHSESRGMELGELRLAASPGERENLESFLLSAAKSLYIWRSRPENGPCAYLGFSDFFKEILLEPEVRADEKAHFLNYNDMLVWHLCLVLSFARTGKLKMSAGGGLSRHSLQLIEESFRYSRQISSDAFREEATFLLEFLTSSRWLELRGSDLAVTGDALDFLAHNGFRLKNEILDWWIKRRFAGDLDFFKHVLFSLRRNASAWNAAHILWTLDPSSRLPPPSAEISWHSLPKPLFELWLLGMVEFSVHAGNVSWVRLTPFAADWLSSSASPMLGAEISSLPNFELIVSVKSAPRVLFLAACLAEVKNDEPYLRFSISKDSYLNGLKTGFSREMAESFEGWINAPANVREAMREWDACYYDSSFRTVRLLKIDNVEVRESLSAFPQFMEMVEESIPGYGFIVHAKFEPKIRELLKHYGLEPANLESKSPAEAFHNPDWSKAFALHFPLKGTPDTAFKPERDGSSVSVALDATKYGGDFQKFEMSDLFKVLRYARSTDGELEARISSKADKRLKLPKLPPELRFKVEELHFSRVPFMAKIRVEPEGKSLELPLESISELRMARQTS